MKRVLEKRVVDLSRAIATDDLKYAMSPFIGDAARISMKSELSTLHWILNAWPNALTQSEITSLAYDTSALPECITDVTMVRFVRAIEERYA